MRAVRVSRRRRVLRHAACSLCGGPAITDRPAGQPALCTDCRLIAAAEPRWHGLLVAAVLLLVLAGVVGAVLGAR